MPSAKKPSIFKKENMDLRWNAIWSSLQNNPWKKIYNKNTKYNYILNLGFWGDFLGPEGAKLRVNMMPIKIHVGKTSLLEGLFWDILVSN